MAIKFKRNLETGRLEVYKDDKKTGEIITMGDEILHNDISKHKHISKQAKQNNSNDNN